MPKFAVINNDTNIVENTIIANSLHDAELATGKTCIEFTNDNPAVIGRTYPISN